MILFKLNNISKHYGSESEGTLRKVLDELSLEINEGESVAILGPSGTGKTTLLNIMGTLDRPDSGNVFFRDNSHVRDDIRVVENANNMSVEYDSESEILTSKIQTGFDDTAERNSAISIAPIDKVSKNTIEKPQSQTANISPEDRKSELRSAARPIVKMHSDNTKAGHPVKLTEQPVVTDLFSSKENLVNYSTKELDTFRNQKIGFVFQMHHLLPQCTLLENVLIPTLTIEDKKIKAERLIRAKELMERVGIWEQRDQMPGHLSGGECQRAAVVRALINQPGLLLADEPTGALDEDNVSKLAMLLLEINKTDRVTLVVVTHSLALAARMDKVYELKNGKLRLKNLKA